MNENEVLADRSDNIEQEMTQSEIDKEYDKLLYNTIRSIDEYIQMLNDTYNEETGSEDPENQKIMLRVFELCSLCNSWMQIANYPKDQFYEL